MSVNGYSGNTVDTRYEKELSSSEVNYGYDSIISDSDDDWFGIQKTELDFGLFRIPISGNNFETQYKDSAYNVFTSGSTDTYGQIYTVKDKLIVPFPDFWNSYTIEVEDELKYSNRDSGAGLNFNITARLDKAKDYAVLVQPDDIGDRGPYYMYTEPHQDTSIFINNAKSWIPYTNYSPSYDNQYYINQIVYHNPESATFVMEILRQAYQDTNIFLYLFQVGIDAVIAGVAAALIVSYSGPGAAVAGIGVATLVALVQGAYHFYQQDKLEQEFLSAISVCDSILVPKYINGRWVQTAVARSGMKQIITKSSFLGLSNYGNLFYRFDAYTGAPIEGPKYLDGYWTYS